MSTRPHAVCWHVMRTLESMPSTLTSRVYSSVGISVSFERSAQGKLQTFYSRVIVVDELVPDEAAGEGRLAYTSSCVYKACKTKCSAFAACIITRTSEDNCAKFTHTRHGEVTRKLASLVTGDGRRRERGHTQAGRERVQGTMGPGSREC